MLMIACSIYFILGQPTEGIMMLVAISFVTAISLYQDVVSTHALQALKQYTERELTVIEGVTKAVDPVVAIQAGRAKGKGMRRHVARVHSSVTCVAGFQREGRDVAMMAVVALERLLRRPDQVSLQ